MRILSRIDRLEDELLPLPAGLPKTLEIKGADSDGTVVSTLVFEIPQTPPPRSWRRHRGSKPRRDW